MKSIFLLIIALVCNYTFSQYKVQTVRRPDGIILNYFNPIPVSRTSMYEAGLSLYKNANEEIYTLALSVLFKNSQPQQLNGNLIIQTIGQNGISLEPVMNRLVNMEGQEVAVSMYSLTTRDIKELSTKTIRMISFNIEDNVSAMFLTENKDVLIREFDIFQSNIKLSSNSSNGQKPDIFNLKSTEDRTSKKSTDPIELFTRGKDKSAPMTRTTAESGAEVYGCNSDTINMNSNSEDRSTAFQESLEQYRSKQQLWYEKPLVIWSIVFVLFTILLISQISKSKSNNK